jgi:transposase
MALLRLSDRDRKILEQVLRQASDARALRRAEALLWVHDGESIDEIADRLRVCSRTIYNWIERFESRADVAVTQRLNDAQRAGRPPTARGIIDPLIDQIITTAPGEAGYSATVWTAGLLRRYLHDAHQIDVSRQSVSAALERLRLRWKRPRHHLSRRSEYWRQSKGGSSAV